MFYSHEVLTSRKHGVATIWLVATLGSKSSFKKVTRKAILEVDIPNACGSIVEPTEPLALRLQGNLLYGVSRVYSQQCGYVLSDTRATRDKMHHALSLIATCKDNALDPKAGQARPEQLIVAEAGDSFVADFALNFDLSQFDVPELSQSTLFSIPSFLSSQPAADVPMLDLGSADTPEGSGNFAGFELGEEPSSVPGNSSQTGRISLLHEAEKGISNTRLTFDDEGNIVDIFDKGDDVGLALPAIGGQATTSVSAIHDGDSPNSAHSKRIQAGKEEGIRVFEDDDQEHQRNQSPATPRQMSQQQQASSAQADEYEVTAEARQQRQRAPRVLKPDDRQELASEVLKSWQTNYVQNMVAANQIKQVHRGCFVAKRNAARFIFGLGIANIGQGLGQNAVSGPLEQFCGSSLLDVLLLTPSRKHPRSESLSSEDEGRRVRARSDERDEAMAQAPQAIDEEEVARAGTAYAAVEDTGILAIGDDDIELPRDAPASMSDRPSSMPWNISATRRSAARYGSISIGGVTSSLGGADQGGMDVGSFPSLNRRRSRMMSSSPLGGRGTSIGRISQLEIPKYQNTAQEAEGDGDGGRGRRSASVASGNFPRVPVDSQVIIAALDVESHNFLEFISADIDAANKGAEFGEEVTTTSFERLLPPADHSKDVAAQAFLHVLSLATKSLIEIKQEQEIGDILINMVEGNQDL